MILRFALSVFSNVYGSGMSNQSIQEMLNAIRKNLAFIGPAGASANYVHVQDVVQALYLCVSHPKAANQTFIVSAWATIEEMASGLAAGAELKALKRRIPCRCRDLDCYNNAMVAAMATVSEPCPGHECA